MPRTSSFTSYDDLAAQAEAGALPVVSGTEERGAAASAAGQQLLMSATNTSTTEAATRVALGRPRLGGDATENTTWKVKAPAQLTLAADALAIKQGKKRSELIRLAVAEYVRVHA